MRASRQARSPELGSVAARGRLGDLKVRTNFREREPALFGKQAKNGAVTFRSEHAEGEARARRVTN